MKPTGPTSKGLNRGRFVASSRRHATASKKHSYTMAASAHMRAAEIAPAHYLGHLRLPSYPRPAVGPKFKRGGKVCTFPKFQTSASHLLFKKAKNKGVPDRNMVPPHPSDSPFVLRGCRNYLSTRRETPAPSVRHPIHRRRPPPHPSPPSSTMPERLPRPRRPLLEMDVSHPRSRTKSLASCPLASSAPSSSFAKKIVII